MRLAAPLVTLGLVAILAGCVGGRAGLEPVPDTTANDSGSRPSTSTL